MMQRTPRRPLWLLMACLLPPAGGCIFTNYVPVPCESADGPPPVPDVGAQQVIESAAMRPAEAPPPPPDPKERLQIPPELPGAGAPPIKLDEDKEKRERQIRELYQPLPPLGDELQPAPGPNALPLTLPDLEQIALARNPRIAQARADVDAARGDAIQAGLYPNPNVGFQADQLGSAGTPGQIGGYVEQLIKTAGKLRLARLASLMGYANAQLALRRAEVDLIGQVRSGYFSLLVARENVRVTRALSKFADEVYRIQIAQVRGGQAAAYEPLQVYVLAAQARTALIQARNRSVSAWKQLAAALSDPKMPLTEVTGRADAPVPEYPYDAALARILSSHTEVGTAENTILRARYNLRLAEVTPIPDIQDHFYVQQDQSTQPHRVQVGVQVGVALPLWDRNQGNILAARAQLARAEQDVLRVRNDLSQQLAAAYERYLNNRALVAYYRDRILPSQVRVYRTMRKRYDVEPEKVGFNDLVTAQQTLGGILATYLQALQAQWEAVVEVATLLQTDDLYELGQDLTHPPSCPLDQLLDPSRSLPTPGTALPPPMPPALPESKSGGPVAPDASTVKQVRFVPAPVGDR
ncbi:MAG: TolC family protein [Planctomycetes bacterium]|nr:TolC family protein [Planctomycetota bacterium]